MNNQKRIGVIAGNGQFPRLFAQAANKQDFQVYAVAYVNETDPALENVVESINWLYLGQVKRLIRYFKKNDVKEAVMLGGINKSRIFQNVRPDIKAISLVARMKNTHDDGILRAFADLLEKEGVTVRPSTFLLPELLAEEGVWTKRAPDAGEMADIELGRTVAIQIGNLDIGQCVVVGGGTVLAVEAIEGTDAAITRGGGFGKGVAVAVKVCKPIQDKRFDVPAIGIRTIQTMIDSGVTALAVEAKKTVVFDKEEMVELADRNGIAIIAV